LKLSQNLAELIFVRDPLLLVRFLKEPTAEMVWFSEGSLKVMEQSKKTVPEWAEYFQVAQEASKDHMLVGAAPLDIEKRLLFVSQAQEFANLLKAANLKAEVDQQELDSTISPSLPEELDLRLQGPWKDDLGLSDSSLRILRGWVTPFHRSSSVFIRVRLKI
jgi:hypothetical protein